MKIKRREMIACEKTRVRAVLREMEALLSAEVADGPLLEMGGYMKTSETGPLVSLMIRRS